MTVDSEERNRKKHSEGYGKEFVRHMTDLLFLHGFPFGPDLWSRQRAFLEARGYRTAAPDLRLEAAPATMEAMASAAVREMDAAGMRQAVVVGFSMGGYVALAMMEHHPERIAGLVLTDTRAGADSEEGKANRRKLANTVLENGPQSAVDALLGKLISPVTAERRPEVVREAERMMLSTAPAAIAAASLGMAERPDRTALLPGIRVPTLVVVGEDDKITPPKEARAMASAIPGASLHIIPRAGHLTMLESPDAFNGALYAWLSDHFE